jgi:hypothetical protein
LRNSLDPSILADSINERGTSFMKLRMRKISNAVIEDR